MTYYKALTQDHKGPYSDFDFTPYLPKGKRPGKWLPKRANLKICESGWHGCEDKQIINFLNAKIYEVEIRGDVIKEDDKFTAEQMRLVKKFHNWNDKTARLFACDCAEHVLSIFEKKYPDDKSPRNCIETARKFANREATPEEMAAAGDAARDAAWAAARDAAGDAARDAARDAAWAAAWAAARAAAWAAAGAAARDAEQDWQWSKLQLLLNGGEHES